MHFQIPRILQITRPWGWIIGPMIYLAPLFTFGGTITLPNIVQCLALSIPLCMLLFGVNDIYDRMTDRLNPRKGKSYGVILDDNEVAKVWRYSIAGAALIIMASLLTGIWQNVVLSIILVLVSIAYSAPPRFKEYPPLDSFSNALIIYLLFAIGHTFISPSLLLPFTGPYISGYALLIGVMSIHMFSTIMDHVPDRRSNVRTLSTMIGRRKTVLAAIFTLMMAIALLQTRNGFILGFLLGSMVIYTLGFIKPDSVTTRRLFLMQFFLFLACSAGFLIEKL